MNLSKEDLDVMWTRAMHEATRSGDAYTRYVFAEMVAAAEREACAKVCRNTEELMWESWDANADPHDQGGAIAAAHLAAAIRARGDV